MCHIAFVCINTATQLDAALRLASEHTKRPQRDAYMYVVKKKQSSCFAQSFEAH